jgi:hypothetical protein
MEATLKHLLIFLPSSILTPTKAYPTIALEVKSNLATVPLINFPTSSYLFDQLLHPAQLAAISSTPEPQLLLWLFFCCLF